MIQYNSYSECSVYNRNTSHLIPFQQILHKMIHLSTNFGINCCIHHLLRCSSLSSQAWQLPRLFVVQMTTSAKPSMGLVCILATILNRQHWQGWFKTGSQSKSLVFTHSVHMLLMSCRPDAQRLQRILMAVDTHPVPRSTQNLFWQSLNCGNSWMRMVLLETMF